MVYLSACPVGRTAVRLHHTALSFLLYPIFGAFVKGLAGISPSITPIIPHFRGICQGVGRDFPLKPPLFYPIFGAFVKGLREGVRKMRFLPPSCRFALLREGNPIGSVPPACRGNLKEGVRNFAYFRTPSGVKGGCSKNGFSCVVFDKGIHQPPLFGAPKGLFAGRIPPLPSGVRGDSSSPRCFGIFGSTRCTLIRPNGGDPVFEHPLRVFENSSSTLRGWQGFSLETTPIILLPEGISLLRSGAVSIITLQQGFWQA
jgi:hypothetical protein